MAFGPSLTNQPLVHTGAPYPGGIWVPVGTAPGDTGLPSLIGIHTGAQWPGGSFQPLGNGSGDALLPVSSFAGFSGGAPARGLSNLNGTVQQLASSGGNVYQMHFENGAGSTAFIQVFDSLAANVNLGTTTPTWEWIVPTLANQDVVFGAQGSALSNGLSFAATTGSRGGAGSGMGNGVHCTATLFANT